MTKYIIDRRLNPKGKSVSNRQRFIRRAKKHLTERVRKNVVDRSITDKGEESISIPTDGIREPTFGTDHETGEYNFVLPGNKEFTRGDQIPKPKGGAGGSGAGGAVAGRGGGGGRRDVPRLGLLAHLLRSLFYSNNGATEVGLKAFGRRVLRPQCFCNGRATPFVDDLAQVGTHRDALDHDAA